MIFEGGNSFPIFYLSQVKHSSKFVSSYWKLSSGSRPEPSRMLWNSFSLGRKDAGKLGLSQKRDARHPRALAGGITHRSGTCSGPEAREKSLFLSDGASAAEPLRLREREVQKDKNMSLNSPVRKWLDTCSSCQHLSKDAVHCYLISTQCHDAQPHVFYPDNKYAACSLSDPDSCYCQDSSDVLTWIVSSLSEDL